MDPRNQTPNQNPQYTGTPNPVPPTPVNQQSQPQLQQQPQQRYQQPSPQQPRQQPQQPQPLYPQPSSQINPQPQYQRPPAPTATAQPTNYQQATPTPQQQAQTQQQYRSKTTGKKTNLLKPILIGAGVLIFVAILAFVLFKFVLSGPSISDQELLRSAFASSLNQQSQTLKYTTTQGDTEITGDFSVNYSDVSNVSLTGDITIETAGQVTRGEIVVPTNEDVVGSAVEVVAAAGVETAG